MKQILGLIMLALVIFGMGFLATSFISAQPVPTDTTTLNTYNNQSKTVEIGVTTVSWIPLLLILAAAVAAGLLVAKAARVI